MLIQGGDRKCLLQSREAITIKSALRPDRRALLHVTDSNGMEMCMLFRNSLAAVIGFVLSVGTAHAANKPNVIYILADDLGYGDLSHAGGRAATPHCDRLAKQGMRFTASHTTSSVCTPTRYGIVTGRYNWRSTLKSGVLWGLSEPLIADDRLTMPKFLQNNGYHTGVIGKCTLALAGRCSQTAKSAKP